MLGPIDFFSQVMVFYKKWCVVYCQDVYVVASYLPQQKKIKNLKQEYSINHKLLKVSRFGGPQKRNSYTALPHRIALRISSNFLKDEYCFHEKDILCLPCEIAVHLNGELIVMTSCRDAGFLGRTYCGWCKRYGGMCRAQLTVAKALEKENQRLKKILAKLGWTMNGNKS